SPGENRAVPSGKREHDLCGRRDPTRDRLARAPPMGVAPPTGALTVHPHALCPMCSRGAPMSSATPVTGPCAAPPPPSGGTAYAQLARLIRQSGPMRRRPGYYSWKITATALLLLAGWAAFVLVGDSWWTLAAAVFLGVMFAQMRFLGHDAGHKQISGS